MAIETAIAVAVLVVGLAGLMEFVHASLTDDRMERAARAAARALALDPTKDVCDPIRRELDLAADFPCAEAPCGSAEAPDGCPNVPWILTVHRGVTPGALPDTLDSSATEGTGDMVVVRIDWSRSERSDDAPEGTRTVPMTAIGLARCELELCGQDTG